MINEHVVISGFTQHMGRPHGMFRLAETLIADGHCDGQANRVRLFPWHANWRNVAEHCWHLREYHECPVRIFVYGYSWGAGYGARKFAQCLVGTGLQIVAMVLSDPVKRSRLVSLRWQAMLPRDLPIVGGPTIRMPTSVKEIWTFHQRVDRPQGHRVVTSNGTLLHASQELSYCHTKMDDAPEFHQLCRDVAVGGPSVH